MEFVITGLIIAAFCAVAYKVWYVPRGASKRGGARDAERHDLDKH